MTETSQQVVRTVGLKEGLNGVNRQPLRTQYLYRQQSNEQANISRQMSQISLIKN